MVQRLPIARPFGHSGRRACHRLCQRCTKGKDVRATIANPSITQPSRTDHKGTELSTSMCPNESIGKQQHKLSPKRHTYPMFYFPFQYREERFRQTSESTNKRVLWWSLAQTIVLVGMGFWQMRHLKTFFETKKLV